MTTGGCSKVPVRWSRWLRGTSVVIAAVSCIAGYASAADELPSEVGSLLPAKAVLDTGSWSVLDHEFGKTFGANMRAEFSGFPSSCDFTIGPELRVEIKGATQLYIDLWISTEAVDAKAMAAEMIDSFQKLDFDPLINPR